MNESNSSAKIDEEQIVDELMAQMAQGVVPWRKPWSNTGVVIGGMLYPLDMWPSNVRAPRSKFGIWNGMMLLTRASVKSYKTNLWISASAVNELNATVIPSDRLPVSLSHGYGRGDVYNIDQIEHCEETLGVSFKKTLPQTLQPKNQYKQSEKLLAQLEANLGLRIRQGRGAAYYSGLDFVSMPLKEDFVALGNASAEANYWATLWHEIVHWTGHPSRLNRKQHVLWGDDAYAFEELIAELGSAFLCRHLGIDGDMQHESYLESWSSRLRRSETTPFAALREAAHQASEAKKLIFDSKNPKNNIELKDAVGPPATTSEWFDELH